jgi:hypothetical protein
MSSRIRKAGVLLVLACSIGLLLAATPAGAAQNNITYNFNEDNGTEVGWFTETIGTAPLWGWNLDPSSTGGGWQAFSGTNGANSASYLTSPCLIISTNTTQYVGFVIQHRYNFPLVDGTANQLGQVQYRVNTTGTQWGDWSGIPTQYFVKPNGNPDPGTYLPNYGPPLFSPLVEWSGTMPVQAWSGSTANFATGIHQPSEFTLQFGDFGLQNGYEIQFRFAMATDALVSGTDTLVWEINKVQIDGVEPCAIPEPETLALAGLGIGGLLLVGRRRRRFRQARKVARSTAVSIAVAVTFAGLVAARPAEAGSTWNFQVNNGGWVRSGASPFFIPPDNKWLWSGTYSGTTPITGGTSSHWRIVAQGIQPPYSSAGFLTSPVFSGLSGTLPAQNARISIAHEFLYATGTDGRPINTGQVQYRLNGSGTWLGLPLSAFTSGSSVLVDDPVFGPSPFKSGTSVTLVNQSSYLAPTYLTPSGTAALSFVSPGAAAFLGSTPNWPGDSYVPSQAFLNANTGLPGTGIASLELRFTNLNLAGNCTQEGWNVRFVQVDFDTGIPPVPEPGTLAIGAGGLATLIATAALRRRRHHRPSRPRESP